MLNIVRKLFDRAIGAGVSILTVSLVVCVVWQVFSRFVLASPSTSTDEIARFLLMWCGLTGAAYMVGQNQHLSIEVLGSHLTGVKKLVLNIAVQMFIATFAIMVMIYGGIVQYNTISMTGQLTPSLGMPMSYIYVVVPISGFIILMYNAFNIVDYLKEMAVKASEEKQQQKPSKKYGEQL
ncbi:TPA: TRAP transporter small permease [Vibrio vulnificus]|nr:TRAP transporter small permease [Vibrio vulnificus]